MKKDTLFQIEAQIAKLETQSDGGIRIVVDTQELTDPEQLKNLFSLRKSTGFFLFKSAGIVAGDLPKAETVEDKERTPSERLRAVIFVFWKEVKGGKGDFNAFYRETIEKYIVNIKEKLPPKE